MKKFIALHHRSLREFVKFALVGLLNTAVDVVLFFVLLHINAPYVAAQAISYSCGAANSYLFNKFWTFQSRGRSYSEVVRFAVVNLVSLAISIAVLSLLHETAALNMATAKAGATACALAANFLGNKLWVFT